MKFGALIPKKASKHSTGSVARLKKDRHKAYFGLKPQKWDTDKDNQIKCNLQMLRLEKRLGLRKSCIIYKAMNHLKSGFYGKRI